MQKIARKLLKTGLLSAAGFLSACSMTRTDFNDRNVVYQDRENIVAYGAEHAKIIGPVFWTNPGKCSEIAFLKQASLSNKKIANIIEVKMEQTVNNTTNAGICEYSGLAVSYESLSAEEAAEWHEIGDSAVVRFDKNAPPKEQQIKSSVAPYVWAGLTTVSTFVLAVLLAAMF